MTVKNGPNTASSFEAQKGKGRPKGAVNKSTKVVKEMILEALDKAGGTNYLLTQAVDNPTAFMTLVGKVLPLDVNNTHAGKIIAEIRRSIVRP